MIYTSYFARANKLKDVCRISISLSTPTWATVEYKLPIFAPTQEILYQYKRDNNVTRYVESYINLLKQREPEITSMVNRLEKYAVDKTILLCCWKAPNKFCHRQILADYVKHGWTEYMESLELI